MTQDEYKWKFSLLTYTHYGNHPSCVYYGCYYHNHQFKCIDFGFTVQVQLSPQQARPQCAGASIVSFTVLITSKGELS